jgi:hypothetical protein
MKCLKNGFLLPKDQLIRTDYPFGILGCELPLREQMLTNTEQNGEHASAYRPWLGSRRYTLDGF